MAMRAMHDLLGRLFDGGTKLDQATKAEVVLSGLNRRRFLTVGGISVASVVVLAACGGENDSSTSDGTTPTTAAGLTSDVAILRTASSLERYAVALYDTAISSGLVKTAAISDAAKLFREQHLEHALLFEGATDAKAAGQAFTEANPALAQMLQPRVDALKSEVDVLKLAYDVEAAAAATYFSNVGAFRDRNLNTSIMSVGSVEARHVAILGGVLKSNDSAPFPVSGFQTVAGAVKAGTGVS